MAFPDAVASLYLSKPRWTLLEASRLLADEIPGRAFHRVNEAQALATVNTLYDALVNDASNGNLKADVKETRSGGQRKDRHMISWGIDRDSDFVPVTITKEWPSAEVEQAELRAWAERRGLRPAVFAAEEKPLSTRERGTLMSILGALIELSGHDLRQAGGHFSIASAIRPELEARGVRVSAQTLADKIAEAHGEIVPKGPGTVTKP